MTWFVPNQVQYDDLGFTRPKRIKSQKEKISHAEYMREWRTQNVKRLERERTRSREYHRKNRDQLNARRRQIYHTRKRKRRT